MMSINKCVIHIIIYYDWNTIFTCTTSQWARIIRNENVPLDVYESKSLQVCKMQFACRHLIKWNNREWEREGVGWDERESSVFDRDGTI